MIIVISIFILILILHKYIKYYLFKKSIYYLETKNPYRRTIKDKRLYEEYLIINELSKLPGNSKFIINAYIPSPTGKITEIDIIFIHETGIYVIELKDYSGWIYGNEENNYWIQILENKEKYSFYNPILQNQAHIKILQNELHFIDCRSFLSLIIFSERCTLKKLDIYSPNIIVLKKNKLIRYFKKSIEQSERLFAPSEINHAYLQLKQYTTISRTKKSNT